LQAQTPAEDLIEAGHWKRARAVVDPMLQKNPKDALANFLASQIGAAFGGRDKPVSLAEKAVSLDGGVAKYHRQLAEAQGLLAAHANVFQQVFIARKFTREIGRALQLDPRDVQALRDHIEFYLLAPGIAGGDKAAARAAAERIGRIDQAEGLAAEARIADFDHDTAQAAAELRQSVAANPAKYKIRMALAQELERRGEFEQEAAVARDAIAADRSRAGGYASLAFALARNGQLADLQVLLGQADRAVPDDWAPHFRAAEGLLGSGRKVEAARELGIYLSQEPEGGEPTAAEANRMLQEIHGRHGAERHMPN
jgi:predicted Zn-dependent protease